LVTTEKSDDALGFRRAEEKTGSWNSDERLRLRLTEIEGALIRMSEVVVC
jgi:hypothetical protein